ncbi:MAG: PQQ-binding-like beta-propeller repeat protein [Planctomycetota bacterium]|nr:PQQ-binding-like beta-propeller repeat protein [Planctomycetota bacterium]
MTMRTQTRLVGTCLCAALVVAGWASRAGYAAESNSPAAAAPNPPGALLGSPGFSPSPERPIGWRGDWTGRYPGATPPLQWSRRVKGLTAELKYQARKPVGEPGKDAAPLEYFTIKDWLVVGPFEATDPKQGIEKDYLGGETAIQPDEGDKTGGLAWRFVHAGMETQTTHIHNGGMCGHLNVDFVYAFGKFSRDEKLNFKVEGDLDHKVAYAHTYIHAPNGGKISLLNLNWGVAAKAWLNGEPLKVVVETNKNVWDKKDIEVTLVQGWNRLLIKVGSPENAFPTGPEPVSRWRSVTYLSPILPASYETRNIAWMTRVTGRSMSQPIVVGDKILFGSAISDLICVNKADGKVLWICSNTPWDALSPEDRAPFKETIEPLATQLDKLNQDATAAIDAMVSAQGMSTAQQAVLDKLLKDKAELEIKIHKAFQTADRKRFPPMSGNEVASSNAAPCSDGTRVYWSCGGGMKGPGASVVCCFDLSGKRVWSYHEAFGAAEHGLHTSPLLVDNKLVYAACKWLVAFDAATGKIVWRQTCDEVDGGSPQVVRIGQEPCILTRGGGRFVTLYRASDGTKIAANDTNLFGVDTPIVENGIVYVPDRFKGWTDANVAFTAFQLPADTAGKPAIKQLFELNWQQDHVPLRGISYWCASPLYINGIVYAMDMSGGLMAVDVTARKSVYRRWLDWYCRYDRYLYGAAASPALGGKNVYLTDNAGYTIIVKPGPVYEELSRNVLENISPSTVSGNPCKQEAFYTSPVFSGNALFLKGEEYLYCIRGQ